MTTQTLTSVIIAALLAGSAAGGVQVTDASLAAAPVAASILRRVMLIGGPPLDIFCLTFVKSTREKSTVRKSRFDAV